MTRRHLLAAAGLTVGAVELGLAAGIRPPAMRIEVIALVFAVGVCAWLGRWHGPLGPVASGVTPRVLRGTSYFLASTWVLLLDIGLRFPPSVADSAGNRWIPPAPVMIYLVIMLVATARSTAAHQNALRIGAMYGTAATTCWWVLMLLLPAVRSHPRWALAFAVTAVLLSSITSARHTESAAASWLAGLVAGGTSCLSIFSAAISTYTALDGLVPNVARFPYGGLTPAALAATNRIEAIDPYVAELVLGALLTLLGVGTIIANRTLVPLWRKHDRPREGEADPAHYAIATQDAAADGDFELLA